MRVRTRLQQGTKIARAEWTRHNREFGNPLTGRPVLLVAVAGMALVLGGLAHSLGRDLADACDLTESRVREALDVATDDGMFYPVDSGPNDDNERYALDESKVGSVAFVLRPQGALFRWRGKRFVSAS